MLALQMPRAKDYDPVSMYECGGDSESYFFLSCNTHSILSRLIFEKYDGIRAIWQPNERQLYSRYERHFFVFFFFVICLLFLCP